MGACSTTTLVATRRLIRSPMTTANIRGSMIGELKNDDGLMNGNGSSIKYILNVLFEPRLQHVTKPTVRPERQSRRRRPVRPAERAPGGHPRELVRRAGRAPRLLPRRPVRPANRAIRRRSLGRLRLCSGRDLPSRNLHLLSRRSRRDGRPDMTACRKFLVRSTRDGGTPFPT